MGPGHAAKLDSLQAVLQRLGAFNLQEADLHPVRTAGTGAVCQVLPVLRECIALKQSEEQKQNVNKESFNILYLAVDVDAINRRLFLDMKTTEDRKSAVITISRIYYVKAEEQKCKRCPKSIKEWC